MTTIITIIILSKIIIFISLTIIRHDENVTKFSLTKTRLKCSDILSTNLTKQKQDKVD